MFDIWQAKIRENRDLVDENAGPTLVTVVTGSESDRAFWHDQLVRTSPDVFRRDGKVLLVAVHERVLKGNFLGTFNAWAETQRWAAGVPETRPPVGLMTMVFGKGTRLSPFTQALGNRKPAFPTPLNAPHSGVYLRTADLANLCSQTWIRQIAGRGFRGVIVKWGDEAVVPGVEWGPGNTDFRDVDAIRFVWLTEPTEDLAREKEWVVRDAATGLMRHQFSRQELGTLRARMAELGESGLEVGVNLGSLALSYQFLEVATQVLAQDIADPGKWANWDPYAWIALCCRDEADWQAEAEREDRAGRTGIRDLEARYPHFYRQIARVRDALEARTGRPLAIGTLDFGQTFWVDLGLHRSLRETMEAMTADSDRGRATRELFGLPHDRDRQGNLLICSQIPPGADIRDSVLVDSIVLDPGSVIDGGVVVGGRLRRVSMPDGGTALFCAADHLRFTGPHGVAFRSMGSRVTVPEGGRHTTLLLPDGPEEMLANESMVDFGGENYTRPILGNRLSFEDAGEMLSRIDGRALEACWRQAWEGWLAG